MRFPLMISAVLVLLVSPAILTAQESTPIPPVVQRQIDDETLVVVRFDLAQPGVENLAAFLADLPDPTRRFGLRTGDLYAFLHALQALKKAHPEQLGSAFAIISTRDLPAESLALVVPASGNDAVRQAVAASLKKSGKGSVDITSDGVVYWTGKPRPASPASDKPPRAEFAAALNAIATSHIQLVLSPGPNARRVFHEFWPELPQVLGGGSGQALAQGLQWIALGITPTDKPEFHFIVQGSDESSTATAAKVLQAGLKQLASEGTARMIGANIDNLVELLKPIRKENRLIIAIDEKNGNQMTLFNKVAAPLITQMQRNGLISNTVNNLKTLMLAMHNYHDVHGAFPAPARLSPDGKPLLSWRVELLPYLDASALYQEFHLNEPWDSEHNRKLIIRMPDVFHSLNISSRQRPQGMTTYLGLSGEKCLFAGPDAKKIRQITDGTSNTIGIVDANSDQAVPWTQPTDLNVDMANPLRWLDGQPEGSFRSAFCDGSVRLIRYTLKPETLRRLFQINDGQPIEEEL